MAGSRVRDIVRRTVGAVVVTTLLVAAVAVGTGLAGPGVAAPSAARTPEVVEPTAPATPTPTISTRTITPAPPPSPTPSPTPTPSESTPVDKPGIVITARPVADGSFLIEEAITLPTAMTEIALRPPTLADMGAGFERLRPAATDIEINAAGRSLAVPDGPVHDAVTLTAEEPTASLQLRYRLTHVSVVSAPAKAGRSLAVLGSLLDRMPADLPVQVVVRGKGVLSITCPQLSLAQMACGAGAAPKLRTRHPIPYGQSRVLVQYDRPPR